MPPFAQAHTQPASPPCAQPHTDATIHTYRFTNAPALFTPTFQQPHARTSPHTLMFTTAHSSTLSPTETHTHTHIHVHTQKCSNTHTYTHIVSPATPSSTHTPTRIHSPQHTYTHAYVCTHVSSTHRRPFIFIWLLTDLLGGSCHPSLSQPRDSSREDNDPFTLSWLEHHPVPFLTSRYQSL